jgi:beta-galactosidase
MSRDMTLYQDDDGKAYLIYSSRENFDLRVAQLTDDYRSVTSHDVMIFSEHREAPAIFKRNGTYYLITSACTGWKPNQARLHVSKSIFGPWQNAGDPMRGTKAETTFDGQSTFILPAPGHKGQFVFMADRWYPNDLGNSPHIWLPIKFENDKPVIDWMDRWDLRIFDVQRAK